jgi:peptide/nickel transport system permease protein
MVLPLVVMIASHLWYYAYMIRNKMLDEARRDYVLLARSKGLGPARILVGHCLRNVLPTIVNIMAISIPHVLSGTYIAESVFNYPGIGFLAVSSAKLHDYNMLMLMVLVTGALVVSSSMIAQGINELIDPRMKARVEID